MNSIESLLNAFHNCKFLSLIILSKVEKKQKNESEFLNVAPAPTVADRAGAIQALSYFGKKKRKKENKE